MKLIFSMIAALTLSSSAAAQIPFDSGSDGSDGVLNFDDGTTETMTIIFDPATFNPPLDPDGDNVYHFTSINIPENYRVVLRSDIMGSTPVQWLCSGDVSIDGHLDLNGQNGRSVADHGRVRAIAGAGGYDGGFGSERSSQREATPGLGPGGGTDTGSAFKDGAGAGHVSRYGGSSYGNEFLVPLIGGSGGAGNNSRTNDSDNILIDSIGGGAGGGAILLSGESITINGSLTANGGSGEWFRTYDGGSGSGGAIRIFTKEFFGDGFISANGSASEDGQSSAGRIRIETFLNNFAGTVSIPGSEYVSYSLPVELSPSFGTVRITHIDGVEVPMDLSGTVEVPDAVIQNPDPVLVEIQTSDIPTTTVMQLRVRAVDGTTQRTANTTPVEEDGTAEAMVEFPRGFSNVWIEATW